MQGNTSTAAAVLRALTQGIDWVPYAADRYPAFDPDDPGNTLVSELDDGGVVLYAPGDGFTLITPAGREVNYRPGRVPVERG